MAERVVIVVLLLAVCLSPFSAQAATPEAVEASLAKGRAYLWKIQKNGNWEEHGDTIAEQKGIRKHFTGRTALVLLALINSGENARDARLQSAVDFILKNQDDSVYALGLRCQLWLALQQTPEIRKAAQTDARMLMNGFSKTGNAKGMYDYSIIPSEVEYSHSRSQYAVLGMWAAQQIGLEVPDIYWKTVEDAWKRNQDRSGGWTYKHPGDTPHPVTPGMTTVGVASLFITQEYLRASEALACRGNQSNPAIESGIAWLTKNIDAFPNNREDDWKERGFPYPTLYAYERVGAASGLRYFGKVDWFEKGTDWVLKTQKPDGSWPADKNPAITSMSDTCFAMLFLAKGRAPIVMGKLQYVDGTTGKEGRWNQRPRDVANVVKWIGRLIERELAFQIINLDVALADIVELPVLSINGSETINLSEAHRAKLKAYIEAGGTVFASADCGDAAFTSQFKNLCKQMFPDYEFGLLAEDHLLYTDYYPRAKWKNKPKVESLSNGARELIFLVPQSDAGKAWQIQDARGKQDLFELAANVLLYAVDKQGLRYRGERYYLPEDPKATAKKTIQVARLQYAGAWDPEPGGWRRMNNLLTKKQQTAVVVKPVELGKGQLADQKIAHLTGTFELKLTDAQQDEIKKFIAAGGTLLIDAAGGSTSFATAVEAELGKLFPNDKLALLPPEHPIFAAGGDQTPVNYRSFAKRTLGRVNAPRLQGITIENRLSVIYSREDLSVGLVGQEVDGIIGYSPESATHLMTSILNTLSGIKPPPAAATKEQKSPAGS